MSDTLSLVRDDVVLCSGGIDSVTLAYTLAPTSQRLSLLFVDYGQAAAAAERAAWSKAVRHLGVEGRTATLRAGTVDSGEIRGRNGMLIATAHMLCDVPGRIAIGVHAGSGYRDCTPEFIRTVQEVFDVQHDGEIELLAPFVAWPKADIVALGRDLGVNFADCHSCEAADVPCGRCRSCRDRVAIGVG